MMINDDILNGFLKCGFFMLFFVQKIQKKMRETEKKNVDEYYLSKSKIMIVRVVCNTSYHTHVCYMYTHPHIYTSIRRFGDSRKRKIETSTYTISIYLSTDHPPCIYLSIYLSTKSKIFGWFL